MDAIGAAARVGRRRAVIDACGEPLVFERNLPQMFLDYGRRGLIGQPTAGRLSRSLLTLPPAAKEKAARVQAPRFAG